MGHRVLILTASVGSGHNIAAGVLESCFSSHDGVDEIFKIDVLDAANDLYRSLYDDAYFAMVEAVPWLVGWGYDVNDPPFKLGNSISLWDRVNTTATVRTIKAYNPDVVVCTHFLPTRLVSLLQNRGTLEATLAVVTTDYDFQGLWLSSPFHQFFVARQETLAHLVDIGVPADRLEVSGIPVRPALGEPIDQTAVRTRYRLRDDVPVLLISAGAAGGPYTKSIVQQTLRMREDFQAVVVCGRNEQLRAEIAQLVTPRATQYRVLGYTTDMADLMRAATLFVGKPGGLSSSECMAAGLPMVLIKPIPGQEVRNSDFLLEEGAAVRCNYDTTVGHKLDSLLRNPARIERMADSARRLGRPDAGPLIVDEVLNEPRPPLWISHAAQRSILTASEQGLATIDLEFGRRTLTLFDTVRGRSVGVITDGQLAILDSHASKSGLSGRRLTLTNQRLRRLQRRLVDPGLLLTLRRILGGAGELELQVGAPVEAEAPV